MRTTAWRWPSKNRVSTPVTVGCWWPPYPTSARCCRSIRICRKLRSHARTFRQLRTICRSARSSMRRGGVLYAAKTNRRILPASRNGAVIPDALIQKIPGLELPGKRRFKTRTTNLVPGLLRLGRRLEEVREIGLIRREGLSRLINELPRVAHHIHRSIRTRPQGEAANRHDLVFRQC